MDSLPHSMRLQIDDGRLFFDVDGAKLRPNGPWLEEVPTVVLLPPGPGADHSSFKDLLGPRLAQVAQVVYVDPRGDGRSDRSSPSRWKLEAWSRDLHALLDALEIERPILLGSSTGALVALHYAAHHPERPERLVLISAVARYVHARSIAAFDRLGGAEAGEVAARYFADPNEGTFADYLRICLPLYSRSGLPPDVIARMSWNPDATIHWDRNETSKVDLRDLAGLVRCPVLMVAGEDDPSSTLAGAEELAAALPQELLQFRPYTGAGHGVIRDQPEALDDVARFITG
jgi:pimeloyl-ACP methyl ester carboxylesterase